MNVKRYFAKTAREALRDLKAELGADAIVLSNRAVEDGVEILALPAEAVGAIEASARGTARPTPSPAAPVRSEMSRPAPRPASVPGAGSNGGATRSAMPPSTRGSALDDVTDDEGDYTISLSSVRSQAGAARQSGGREGSLDAAEVRPFSPPPAKASHTQFEGARSSSATRFDMISDGDFSAQADMDFIMPPRRSTSAYADIDGLDPVPGASRPAPRAQRPEERTRPEREQGHGQIPVPNTGRVDRLAERVTEATPEPARPFGADDERIRLLQEANTQLMGELGSIRGMIERQLAGFAWGETRRNAPARAQIVGELLEAGFSGRLARALAEAVDEQATVEEAHEQVRAALARDLRAMSSDADLIDQGGVYALVGPTGVGKTTTTAKIAARCVVRHGAEKLALITTDGYRIGAQEQLRIYGRILGVPVFPVRDAADLRQTLAELRGKHMVLIDTVGMSQRDRMVAQQAAMLMGAGNVRRLLLLNSTSRGDTLDDVIQAYRGPDLAGCVLTKIDEAASLAPAIGAAISHELDVFYVTNGQRVPEDLHLPNRSYLMHRALKARPDDSPWRMQTDEAALMMAAGGMER